MTELQSRIAHLEHLLSIALPVARAAIEEDARIVDVLGTKFSGTRRLIRALSPEERVEILEGGTE